MFLNTCLSLARETFRSAALLLCPDFLVAVTVVIAAFLLVWAVPLPLLLCCRDTWCLPCVDLWLFVGSMLVATDNVVSLCCCFMVMVLVVLVTLMQVTVCTCISVVLFACLDTGVAESCDVRVSLLCRGCWKWS
ncbi:unnamed protein product [Polarella glacialis]|uniref:Uncharacterized protein n=1 Tax=Polarella glacialis TaxID=89957 RepID=A0A813GYX4_POLGL|nr:unnamed protein product [Polarella glacialis]